MVETSTQIQEDFKRIRAMIDEIENPTKGKDLCEIEEYEELQRKVKPKIVFAAKQLNDAA
jgi:hypothetical protein